MIIKHTKNKYKKYIHKKKKNHSVLVKGMGQLCVHVYTVQGKSLRFMTVFIERNYNRHTGTCSSRRAVWHQDRSNLL